MKYLPILWRRFMATGRSLDGTHDLQGHRGARGKRPENTIPAFEYCIEHQMTTIELDTGVTKDKQLIVNHDTTVNGEICLYENGEPTAEVTMTQLSIGFQWGGQAYSEFIFFKDDLALDHFKRGNFEVGAQASAVAVTAGASADASYSGGVAIFTQAKGGLMYEASIGGQKFKFKPKE